MMLDWRVELDKILLYPLPQLDPFRPVSDHGIVLYGAGAMGHMALDFLETISSLPRYMIDKKAQGEIRGVQIISPKDTPEWDRKSLTFIVCVATAPVQPIIDYLHSLGCIDVRHFYDYTEIALQSKISNGWLLWNPSDDDKDGITDVLKAVEHDTYSVAHYLQFLWWRLRRVEYLYVDFPVLSNKKYFKAPCFPPLSKNESLLDGGAHVGSTIKSFLEAVHENFEYIWAFEPDSYNRQTLQSTKISSNAHKIDVQGMALSNNDQDVMFNESLGFASKIDTEGIKKIQAIKIDTLSIAPTLIKLHLEGYELSALRGAYQTIVAHRPILMVLADHNNEGLYAIGRFLGKLEKYRLYFYLHDYCGNSAVFYAIPNERFS